MGLLSGSDPIVAYDIDIGMHLVLCHGPCDELQEIYVGERLAWDTGSTGGQITINAPGLFGDEGGVAGTVDVLMGLPSQIQNDYLQARLGADIPAFRGVMSLVLRQIYMGRSAYLKPWALKVKRTDIQTSGVAQWYLAKADINGDMNPAHILRECLTNESWGLGYPVSQIDDVDFTALADTLYTEDFGLSFEWTNQESIEAFIQRIMDHVDGRIYVHPSTGLFNTMLVRDGYSLDGLFVADESNVLSLDLFERRGWGDAVNELTVIYRDRENNQDTPVTLQDIGNAQVQGRVVAETRHYPGISNENLALRVCQRDLRALSAGLAHAKITVDRKGWKGSPGDPFKFTWAKYGITEVVFRVVSIDSGTLTDGRLIVDIVEDVFGLPSGTYLGQQPTGWIAPNTLPAAAPDEQTKEATFWEVRKYARAADVATWGTDFGFAVAHATKPSEDSLNYEVWSREGAAEYQYQTRGIFCPTAELSSAVGYGATGLTSVVWNIEAFGKLSGVVADSYAWIDDEALAVQAVDEGAGTITIDRGVMDTVPAPHAANALIWFADNHLGIDDDLHISPTTVDLKILPQTSLGTLDISLAATLQQGINWRYHRPYPPGNVELNTVAYPAAISGTLTVSWSHRDRNLQLDYLHTQTEGDIGPEVGTTYEIDIYGDGDVLQAQLIGLTGTSYVWSTEPGGSHAQKVVSYGAGWFWRFDETAVGSSIFDEITSVERAPYGTGTADLTVAPLINDSLSACELFGDSGFGQSDLNTASADKLAVEVMVEFDSLTGQRTIFKDGGSLRGVECGLYNNNLGIWVRDSGGTLVKLEYATSGLSINTLYHVIFNIDGVNGDMEIWIGGSKVASDYALGAFTDWDGTDGTSIGCINGFSIESPADGSIGGSIRGYLDGMMDELAVYQDYLSQAVCEDLYDAAIVSGGIKNTALRVVLRSRRDGLASLQEHNILLGRAGYGYNYGNFYGGP